VSELASEPSTQRELASEPSTQREPSDQSSGPRTEPIDGLGYEQARDELADVVRKLEAGGLSLDDAVALWERGEALARRCDEQLAGARERVQRVLDAAE
jgi:exodeoxyribonuclease VII small subunit